MWTCYLFTVFLFLSKSIKQPSGLVRRPLLHARHNYDILTPKKLTQKRRCLFSVGKQFAKFYILYKLMRTVCMYVKCLVHLVFASQTVYFYSWTARAVCVIVNTTISRSLKNKKIWFTSRNGLGNDKIINKLNVQCKLDF